mmetsp:Transcript_78959/g.118704  ORF Transcript_78959/g.118704 Transcript_78959/m.118704 type:complete len:114 (+) Transcript_78959:2-343(+)
MNSALRVTRLGAPLQRSVGLRIAPTFVRGFFVPDKGPNITTTKPHGLYTPQAAVDLVHEDPPTQVTTTTVKCDGGGPLGHPTLYINLETEGDIKVCMYCGTRYQRVSKHPKKE